MRGRSPPGIQRVGGERRRIGGHAGIHAVAVVERLSISVDAAESASRGQPVVHVHFQRVVGADSLGDPVVVFHTAGLASPVLPAVIVCVG